MGLIKTTGYLQLLHDGLTDPESSGSNRYPICKTVNFGVNIQF